MYDESRLLLCLRMHTDLPWLTCRDCGLSHEASQILSLNFLEKMSLVVKLPLLAAVVDTLRL